MNIRALSVGMGKRCRADGLLVVGFMLLSIGLPASFASTVHVVIPWQDGATFTTNINLYVKNLGDTNTVVVTPANCCRFKGTVTATPTAGGLSVIPTTSMATPAVFQVWLVGMKEGTVTISGTIEYDPAWCAGGGHGQGSSNTKTNGEQGFEINVLQKQVWIQFTDPTNGTNLTTCAGCTNNVEVKVTLGDNTPPSSGTVTFSRSPSNLGTVTLSSVLLDSMGKASIKFIAPTNNVISSGSITAAAANLISPVGAPITGTVSTNITVRIPKINLAAMKISHNTASGELTEAEEDNPGAFLPLNNDDDDYSATSNDLGEDRSQTGAIAGEDDLLPIILHKVDPVAAGGTYSLSIPSNIKLWKNSDRTGMVDNSTTFPANIDTTLYAEGITTGAGEIVLKWTDGSISCDRGDSIKITVFFWLGPLNVPQYSVHQYLAAGAESGSKWDTPVNGTIKTGSGTSNVSIQWVAGAVVGRAVYEVNSNYMWDLEVNIVKIELQMTTGQFDLSGPPQQGNPINQILSSGGPEPTMKAELKVLTIEGPAVAGGRRGVKFMEMGFIQNARMTKRYGDYDGFSPPQRYKNSAQDGEFHVDSDGALDPWYAPDALLHLCYLKPPADSTLNNKNFSTEDTPFITVVPFNKMALTWGSQVDTVDRFGLVMDFHTYFAVRSVQDINGASEAYMQRAFADWQFDGSGTIGVAGAWTLTGLGISGSSSFSEVTDGSLVPVTTGTIMNDLIRPPLSTWTLIDQ